jgi:glycosyltransferase involved in cell wall biosynthesis
LGRLLDLVPQDVAVVVSARGARARELTAEVRDRPSAYVLPPLTDAEWRWVIRHTDIACVALDRRASLVSVPSKIYPALGAGSVILGVAEPDSDLADIIQRAGCGIVVEPENEEEILLALLRLATKSEERQRFQAAARAASETTTPVALAASWKDVLEVPLEDSE